MFNRFVALAALALSLGHSATASAATTYDLATDFSTTTQGVNGWYYQYDPDGSGNYFNMGYGATGFSFDGWVPANCNDAFVRDAGGQISAHTSLCDGWTTISWKAPANGDATYNVSATRADLAGGSGVEAELRDEMGNLLWSQLLLDGSTYSDTGTVTMARGDRIYLRLNMGVDTSNDTTTVTFSVSHDTTAGTTVPFMGPFGLLALSMGLGGAGALGLRRRENES